MNPRDEINEFNSRVFAAILLVPIIRYCDSLLSGPRLDSYAPYIQCILRGLSVDELLKKWQAHRLRIYAAHVIGGILSKFVTFPGSLMVFVSSRWLVGGVLTPLFRYLGSEGADERNLCDLVLNGVPALSFVGTAVLMRNAGAVWFFAMCVLFHPIAKLSYIAVVLVSVTWLFGPEGGLKDFFRAKARAVLIAMILWSLSMVKFCRKFWGRLLNTLGRYEAAWVEKRKLPRASYVYQELKHPREIRLLRLERRKPFVELRCKMIHVNLDSLPSFEAISYTWGNPEPRMEVVVGGSQLEVTPEVYKILHYRQSFLGPKLLWIDAVCINQKDNRERSDQVRIMRDIYQHAFRVVVWLGSPEEMPNVFPAWLMTLYLTTLKHQFGYLSKDFTKLIQTKGSPGWGAMAELFSRRWFNRVWVVQEAAVAKTLHVMCGGVCFEWAMIVAAVDILLDPAILNSSQLVRGHTLNQEIKDRWFHLANARLIALYRDIVRTHTPVSFADALMRFISFESTDPRDKVFALLGIVAQGGEMPLIPDYDKPFQKVYHETMRVLLSLDKPLAIIPFAGIGFPRFQDVPENDIPPSWVADWRFAGRANSEVGVVDLSQDQGSERIKFSDDGCTMELEGAYLDSIKKLSSLHDLTLKPRVDFNMSYLMGMIRDWYWEAKAMAFEYSRNPYARKPDGTIETIDEAFWRTIICDRFEEQHPAPIECREYWKGFEFSLDNFDKSGPAAANTSEEATRERTTQANRFSYSVGAGALGRRLCVTERGHLAVVPPLSQQGDLICRFRGSATPFVLRAQPGQTAGEAPRHLLVGSCYAHRVLEIEKGNAETVRFYLV